MKFKHLLCLLAITFFYFPVFGQDAPPCNTGKLVDPLLEQFVGNWIAKGVEKGDSVTYEVSVQWELNHQFLFCSFRTVGATSTDVAHAYIGYDCAGVRFVMHWMDIAGGNPSDVLGFGNLDSQQVFFKFEYPAGTTTTSFLYIPRQASWKFLSTTTNNEGKRVILRDLILRKKDQAKT